MVGHVEDELQTIGRSIHAAFPTRQRHPLRALDTKAMELAGQDQELRAALFRLVDVTPACTSLDDLARHLTAFLDEVDERPPPIAAAMRMSQTRAGRAALGAAAAAGVRHMAHRFIVGETPRAALRSLRHLWEHGAAVSLDLLGEATVTQPEADRYAARCLDALETLAEATPPGPRGPQLESDSLGPLPRVNVAVKVSALTPLLRPEAPEVGRDDAARRMLPLLVRAKELGAHLHIDMESVDTLEATMRLVFDLLEQPELRDGPSTGIVLQAYLRESPEQLEQVLDWASATARQPPLVVRLVKGAYWDHEIVEARQHGWTPPVFEQKAESDRNFERLTRRLIEGWPHVRPADRLAQPALGRPRGCGQPRRRARRQRHRAAGAARARRRPGRGARRPGNARAHLLSGGRHGGWDGLPGAAAAGEHGQRLLPQRAAARRSARGAARRAVTFRNEPILELRRAAEREALLEALTGLDAQLPLAVPVLIGGDRGAAEGLESTDPGTPARAGRLRRPRRRGRGRGGGRGGAARLSRVGRAAGGRARGGPARRRGAPARAAPRACRPAGARVREAVAGGRRRRLRGDRLPRVLRPRRRSSWSAAPS